MRPCQESWQNFAMTERLLQPDAFREILRAETKLAHMAIATDYLDLWRTETCPRLQEQFADRYRRMTGVAPAQEKELSAGLELIRQTGRGAVADLVAALNRINQPPPSEGFEQSHLRVSER